MSRDNARTPMQWDASPRRRLHDRHAVDRGQPEPRRDQREAARWRPGLGLPPLPPADRAAAHASRRSPTATSRCCCRTTRRSTRSSAGSATTSCWRSPTSPATRCDRPSPTTADWLEAELLLGNVADSCGPRARAVGGAGSPACGDWPHGDRRPTWCRPGRRSGPTTTSFWSGRARARARGWS